MNEFTGAAGKAGSRMRLLGGLTILLGLLALMTPMLTGYSIILLIGGLVVVAGGLRMWWAFGAGSLGQGLLVFALGGLTLICGLALLANPLFASGLVTLLMTLYFIADLGRRPESGWGWLLFGGVISIALGIMLWRQAPLAGAWALGLFFGIKLIFAGIMMLTLGSAVKAVARG